MELASQSPEHCFLVNRLHQHERGPMHFAKESAIMLIINSSFLGPYTEHCFLVNRTYPYAYYKPFLPTSPGPNSARCFSLNRATLREEGAGAPRKTWTLQESSHGLMPSALLWWLPQENVFPQHQTLHIKSCCTKFPSYTLWCVSMLYSLQGPQELGALVTLAEVLGLIPSTHTETNNQL